MKLGREWVSKISRLEGVLNTYRVGFPATKFELVIDAAFPTVRTCPVVGLLLVNRRKMTSVLTFHRGAISGSCSSCRLAKCIFPSPSGIRFHSGTNSGANSFSGNSGANSFSGNSRPNSSLMGNSEKSSSRRGVAMAEDGMEILFKKMFRNRNGHCALTHSQDGRNHE